MSPRVPDFFIAGAPKCGTSSLAHWLEAHPRIYMSPIKEPHYYSTDLANRSVTSPEQYAALFRGATEGHGAIGEASTWYLFSRDAIPAIERDRPDARYIVMTRDPVTMVQSLYHHNRRVLHEDQPTLEGAWRLQSERAAGMALPRGCVEPAFLQYKQACSLGSLLQRLYERVPVERVLHIQLERLQKDPGAEYRHVLDFLGVDHDGRTAFPAANEARGHRSRTLQRLIRGGGRARGALGIKRGLGLARINDKTQPKEVLSEGFRAELDDAFSEERQKLRDLTR